jgi:transcriptional regulator with GAF, ATPase, and Fis domain
MQWDATTRYEILLKINNAISTYNTRETLFRAVARELCKHFPYDGLSINLYDPKSKTLKHFAAAEGIYPGDIPFKEKRPLKKSSVTAMVIESGCPTIIENLTEHSHIESTSIVKAGLTAVMVFPLIIREQVLGTIQFYFKKTPDHLSELKKVLNDLSRQIAIAVYNMLAYCELRTQNANLNRQKRFLLENADDNYRQNNFFFASSSVKKIIELTEKIADTDASVFITGETGTGKEHVARRIYYRSNCDGLFVKVNCPALTPTLFEDELFGHKKGAYTGADSRRVGRFEMASGGTVFLDEIAELPPNLQAKLLHVLQDHRFEIVGDSKPIDVNFRVIAATNKDIDECMRTGSFRKDLYYRLSTVLINIPPLRKRKEDIPLLVESLTELEAKKTNKQATTYTIRALDLMSRYSWPGNVRELKNFVRRMLILRSGEHITEKIVHESLKFMDPVTSSKEMTKLAHVERDHIESVLNKCNGIVAGRYGAAHFLGLPRSTLLYRIKKYGINIEEFRQPSKVSYSLAQR